MPINEDFLLRFAQDAIAAASSEHGIFASKENNDNYKRIWARDLSVTTLALLQHRQVSLLEAAKSGLKKLAQAANTKGQIPSNISIDGNGTIISKSFGGPVGRTDCGFWWIIAAVNVLKLHPDKAFEAEVLKVATKILELAESWEFNDKHLMYVPMSSNWADEYILEGYVLFDQLLRIWALELVANHWSIDQYQQKSNAIKLSIRYHFLREDVACTSILFTAAQQAASKEIPFIASFTPGEFITQKDGWSMALLLLLNIPGLVKRKWIIEQIEQVFKHHHEKGVPAFWPVITTADKEFSKLQSNHAFQFKNHPHYFHNGGIWPVVNAFIINALYTRGAKDLAQHLKFSLHTQLDANLAEYPFPEYFNAKTYIAEGVKNLCFSASAVLLTTFPNNTENSFLKFFPFGESEIKTNQSIQSTTIILAQAINYLQPSEKPLVLAIAGESGSGKTVTARGLQELYAAKGKKVIILHLDDYFKLPPAQNHQMRVKNFDWVGKEEVRLDLLQRHIYAIVHQQKATIDIPKMNWSTDSEESESIDIKNCDVLLIEGTYSLFLDGIHFKIFMEHSYHDTLKNRIQRNREPLSDFSQKILEKEHHIIKQQRALANMVIKTDYSLEVIKKMDA